MLRTKKAATFSTPVKIAVILILLFLVIVPILKMFSSMTGDDISSVLKDPLFFNALTNSIVLSATATLIVIILAYLLAYCMNRTEMPLKKLFGVILILPMLIPSISHGMGLIILFGGNGVIKNLLGWENTVYGPVGIVLGSVLYAFPVAYIMLSDVLKYEDRSVYEAADVLGIGRLRQFGRITLPYLKKPLIAATFSTFSMIVTDYGVPLMIGGKTKTLSLMMYEEVIGQLDFGKGSVYGAFLLIPAIIAFITDLLNKERASAAFVHKDLQKKSFSIREGFALTVCALVSLFALLPIFSFVVLAFAKSYPRDMSLTMGNLSNTLARGGAEYLVNSLLIALLTAIAGTAFAYLTAYLSARMHSGLSHVIHLLTLTFMAVPGIVLGLSYVVLFNASFIYGTLFIMIMVNTAHFMSSPYLMMYNSFGKMNENLESVGTTLGISRVRMIKDVFIPQNAGTIAEMFSYLFVNCMMTISAVSFLANTNTKPISLMINQFEAQMDYECAAVVSLIILLVNILVKILVGILKALLYKKSRKEQKNAI